uniref:Uncharacterized protein n=1 Tax=Schistosoma japonicum TaxID=6182 RepID=B3GUZ7_SCHJA
MTQISSSSCICMQHEIIHFLEVIQFHSNKHLSIIVDVCFHSSFFFHRSYVCIITNVLVLFVCMYV